jgi:hypothetical protein
MGFVLEHGEAGVDVPVAMRGGSDSGGIEEGGVGRGVGEKVRVRGRGGVGG